MARSVLVVVAAVAACVNSTELVVLTSCAPSPSQAFQSLNGNIVATGLCLTALDVIEGSFFSMLPCNSSSSQQFTTGSDATICLRDLPSMCLDGRETNVTGASVHLWPKLGKGCFKHCRRCLRRRAMMCINCMLLEPSLHSDSHCYCCSQPHTAMASILATPAD